MKNALKNISLVFVSISLGLVLLEIGLRLFEPFEMRLHGTEIRLAKNHTKVIKNDLRVVKLDPIIYHSKNAIGFRGEDPPSDYEERLTIVAVGGSTTEGYYLSDGQTWPEVMSSMLSRNFDRVWVNNAGLDGHSTFGHAYLLRDYLSPLPPKIAIFLVGLNDVGLDKLNRFDDFMVTDLRVHRKTIWQAIFDGKERLDTFSRYSHLVALIQLVVNKTRIVNMGFGHGDIDLNRELPLSLSEEDRKQQLEIHREVYAPLYKIRLTHLLNLAQSLRITPVLVTQPALFGREVDPTTGIDLAPLSDFYWDRLQIYNDVTREFAEEMSVALIDLADAMPKDSRFYYDWVHYNREGAVKVAEIVSMRMTDLVREKFPEFIK